MRGGLSRKFEKNESSKQKRILQPGNKPFLDLEARQAQMESERMLVLKSVVDKEKGLLEAPTIGLQGLFKLLILREEKASTTIVILRDISLTAS